MSASVVVPWDDALIGYDFGHRHPLNPLRARPHDAAGPRSSGCSTSTRDVVPPETADRRPAAPGARRATTSRPSARRVPTRAGADLARGLGTARQPGVRRHARGVGAGRRGHASRRPRRSGPGEAEHAVNIAGGLHHAMPGAASGFCVYNDPAIAIAWLLEQGAERVAYVDVDVHHGDGVERVFWDDPRVLTISIHESGRYLFPGTGFPDDVGGAGGRGHAVNIALPPGTSRRRLAARVRRGRAGAARGVPARRAGDAARLRQPRARPARPSRVSPSTASGRPTRCCTTGARATRAAGGWPRGRRLRARRGRAAGVEPPDRRGRRDRRSSRRPRCPSEWREYVAARSALAAPRADDRRRDADLARLVDGYDPADALDRAVLATQRAVFPAHGLGGLLGL